MSEEGKCPAVMSRPQLGCICIPNTESTPAVESSEQYPGTGYKIVSLCSSHSGFLEHWSGRLDFVSAFMKFVFTPTVEYLIFSIHMSESVSGLCIVATFKGLKKLIYCKFVLIKINTHDPNRPNKDIRTTVSAPDDINTARLNTVS